MTLSGLFTSAIAVILDTAFYTPHNITWGDLLWRPVLTPMNNLMYNMSTANLAEHGLQDAQEASILNELPRATVARRRGHQQRRLPPVGRRRL